jgi:hypothetical protein
MIEDRLCSSPVCAREASLITLGEKRLRRLLNT